MLSCTGSSSVRELAIKNEVFFTPVNNIIELYSSYHYELPENYNQIIEFLKEWKKQDPDSFWLDYDNTDNTDKIEEMRALAPQGEFYRDSIFLYYQQLNTGVCVYGHPYYWLEHPERFPEDRMDYDSFFRPSAFDSDGNIDFCFNREGLQEKLDEIGRFYKYQFVSENKFAGERFRDYYPARVICEFYKDSQSLVFKTQIPSNLFSLDIDAGDVKTSIEENTMEICSQYFEDITNELKKELIDNPSIDKFILSLNLYYSKMDKPREVMIDNPTIDNIIMPFNIDYSEIDE